MRVLCEISAARTTTACRTRALRSTIGRERNWRIDPLRIAWYTGGESRIQVPDEWWRGYQGRVCFSGRYLDARRRTREICEVI